jgi:Zn-dependent protease/CBS domain-containing protein
MLLSMQHNYPVQKQLAPGTAISIALSEDTTMKANVRLGRIWNIPIGLNSSWFLIFALSTWSLAMGFFPAAIADLPAGVYWLLGALTSVLFFGSVLAHELGHAFLALRNSVPVRAITLFFFGGVAEITREPRSAGAEFRIAIAGPLVSIALAALFGLVGLLAQAVPEIAAPAQWLARINLILALFNMLPAFPLDGGRVLRAALWRFTGSELRATTQAARVGQLFAWGMVGFGVLTALTGNLINGIWLAILGLFINGAAVGSRQQASVQQALAGVTAGQLMSRTILRVPSWVTAGDLLTPSTLSQGHRVFLVEDFGELRGLLSLSDVAQRSPNQWRTAKVDQLLTPWDDMVTVQPDADGADVLRLLAERQLGQVLVIEPGARQVLGVVGPEQIQNYLRLHAELGGQRGQVSSQPAA